MSNEALLAALWTALDIFHLQSVAQKRSPPFAFEKAPMRLLLFMAALVLFPAWQAEGPAGTNSPTLEISSAAIHCSQERSSRDWDSFTPDSSAALALKGTPYTALLTANIPSDKRHRAQQPTQLQLRPAPNLQSRLLESKWEIRWEGPEGIPDPVQTEIWGLDARFLVRDQVLFVSGSIGSDFDKRLIEALNSAPQVTTVSLGSDGGSVIAAILAGSEIRLRRLNTELHGPCISGCPIVFAGGVERKIIDPQRTRLGFHVIYDDTGPIPLSSTTYGHLAYYFTAIGIDPNIVFSWMREADPKAIYEPDDKELCASAFATYIKQVCGSELPENRELR
ncbi:hypothetical protein LZA78_02780 [Sinirhodobacter sp. WL0062]|uniref:Alpha/beta hydrolase n=1 Tax=Rhodobacter flavimaris TaxID=2907145 RepID=A0ABS8YT07_9RHOB|nr:hypothetical protein [Sinirhodobacter sp. WL0062]MCE5972415.1 hypothetical protein [Sinirhodobacter sp. WL0062]